MIVQSFASIGTGIIIGFAYSWQLALFILALMPFFLVASMIQMKFAKGFSANGREILEEAGKVWGETSVFADFSRLPFHFLAEHSRHSFF